MKKTFTILSVVALIAISAVFLHAGTFASTDMYIPAPFKLIFGSALSGDVVLSQSAADVLTLASGDTLAITTADKLTVGGLIVPQHITVSFVDGATGSATDRNFWIAPAAYQVTGCSEIHSAAAGGASKLEVVKDTGTTAPGGGTDLLTDNTNTGFDLAATANTLQNGTLSVTASDLQLAAGDRLSVDYANAIQSSAGVTVTCALKRI